MITGVAIKTLGGTYSLPKPNRHHNVIRHLFDKGLKSHGVQGFITDTGEFMNREQARSYAVAIGQVRSEDTDHARLLFSEDLW